MRRKRQGNRNIISSYSYSVDQLDAVEAAADYAESRGWSLSQLIIDMFNKIKHQQNAHERFQKKLVEDEMKVKINDELRKYLDLIMEVEDMQELREINLTGQDITRITGKKIGDKLSQADLKKNRVLPFNYERSFNLKEE